MVDSAIIILGIVLVLSVSALLIGVYRAYLLKKMEKEQSHILSILGTTELGEVPPVQTPVQVQPQLSQPIVQPIQPQYQAPLQAPIQPIPQYQPIAPQPVLQPQYKQGQFIPPPPKQPKQSAWDLKKQDPEWVAKMKQRAENMRLAKERKKAEREQQAKQSQQIPGVPVQPQQQFQEPSAAQIMNNNQG